MPVLRVIGGPCDGQTFRLDDGYHSDHVQVIEHLPMPPLYETPSSSMVPVANINTYKIIPFYFGETVIARFLVPPDWTAQKLLERLASGYLVPDLKKTPWLA